MSKDTLVTIILFLILWSSLSTLTFLLMTNLNKGGCTPTEITVEVTE